MTHVDTSMRAAFVKAANKAATVSPEVKSALRRKVGVVKRHTMWSVQRGKR